MILHLINLFREAHRKREESKKAFRHPHPHPPDPKRFKVWGIRSNKRTHEDNKTES